MPMMMRFGGTTNPIQSKPQSQSRPPQNMNPFVNPLTTNHETQGVESFVLNSTHGNRYNGEKLHETLEFRCDRRRRKPYIVPLI